MRVTDELRPLIVEFCQSDGNWITHKRVSKEYARAKKNIAQRRDAANTRWLKEKEASERTAKSYRFRIAPTLIPTPIQSESSNTSTEAARDAAPERSSSAPRARRLTMKERMAQTVAAHHQKIAGNA